MYLIRIAPRNRLAAAWIAALACALTLAPRAALAQTPPPDVPARVAQLEAENAVLKLEVRALRERIGAVEEIVRVRLGTKAPAAGRWPGADAGADGEVEARVSPDRRSFIVPGLELSRGGTTPEETARALAQALSTGTGLPASAPAAIARELGAFSGTGTFALDALWAYARPRSFDAIPTEAELVAALSTLGGTGGPVESRCKAIRADGPYVALDVRLLDAAGGERRITLTTVRVNGRCLIVHVKSGPAVKAARTAIERIAEAQRRLVAGSGRPATTFEELDRRLVGTSAPPLEIAGARRDGDAAIRCGVYLVELAPVGEKDYTLVASSEDPTYPALLYGPVANAFDPKKDPYFVREIGGWEPPQSEPTDEPGGAEAVGWLRTITTAQALFREGDKDKNNVLDYAASLADLEKCGLVDFGRVDETGTCWRQGWGVRILQADGNTWSAIAFEITRPGGAAGDPKRSLFVDESGVIRWSAGKAADANSGAIGR